MKLVLCSFVSSGIVYGQLKLYGCGWTLRIRLNFEKGRVPTVLLSSKAAGSRVWTSDTVLTVAAPHTIALYGTLVMSLCDPCLTWSAQIGTCASRTCGSCQWNVSRVFLLMKPSQK
ncbi:hypothetical protein RRG08_023644 [Elysia crispata]|uniref:Uncharacterized protein n=1 Tax=Elysia crispata TaxID=231223 RepID=A0AAE0XSH9_9GAST|nr:hypothetical protein RRG08_023644 [Elysia crispata]